MRAHIQGMRTRKSGPRSIEIQHSERDDESVVYMCVNVPGEDIPGTGSDVYHVEILLDRQSTMALINALHEAETTSRFKRRTL